MGAAKQPTMDVTFLSYPVFVEAENIKLERHIGLMTTNQHWLPDDLRKKHIHREKAVKLYQLCTPLQDVVHPDRMAFSPLASLDLPHQIQGSDDSAVNFFLKNSSASFSASSSASILGCRHSQMPQQHSDGLRHSVYASRNWRSCGMII